MSDADVQRLREFADKETIEPASWFLDLADRIEALEQENARLNEREGLYKDLEQENARLREERDEWKHLHTLRERLKLDQLPRR